MHSDDRIRPHEEDLHRHRVLPTGQVAGPGAEVGRGAKLDVDADLAQCRLDVFGDHALVVVCRRDGVERKGDPPIAAAVSRESGCVEQLGRLGQIELVALDRIVVVRAARVDRRLGSEGQAAVQLVDDEVLVDRVGDGLADLLDARDLVLHVELDGHHCADALEATWGDGEGIDARGALEVGDALDVRDVDFAVLHLGQRFVGGRPGHHDQLVHVGPSEEEVLEGGHAHDAVGGVELLECERPGANEVSRRVVACAVADVLDLAVDVLGEDLQQAGAEGDEDRGVRLAEVDDHGGGIGCVDRRHRAEHGLERMVLLGHVEREGHVV